MATDPGPAEISRQSFQAAVRDLIDRLKAHPGDLRPFIDATTLPVVLFDPSRKIVGASAAADAFFAAPPGGLDGLSIDDLIPLRLRTPAPTPTPPLADLVQIELPSLARDGTERVAEWVLGTAWPASGYLFVTAFRDPGEVERAREQLRQSEERFRLLIESVRDYAIFLLDPSGKVVTWNPGAERLMGYRGDEIIGQHVSRFHPDDEARAGTVDRILSQAARDGRAEVEGWRVRRDGSRFWAEVVVAALKDSSGRPVGFAKTTRDLTEKKQSEENVRRFLEERLARTAAERAEAAAREQGRRHQVLAEASKFFTRAVLDQETALKEFARRCADLMGDSCIVVIPADEPGMIEIKAVHKHETDAHDLIEGLVGRRVAANGLGGRVLRTARSIIMPLVKPEDVRADHDGVFVPLLERFPVFSLIAVPLQAGGRVMAVATLLRHTPGRPYDAGDLTVVEDLATRVGLALENAWLYRDLQTALRGRDELLAVVSHDLRNPLSAVLLNAGQLARSSIEPTPERSRELGRRIEKAGRRMDRLLQDLLDRARIESGKALSVSPAPTEVALLLKEAAETFEALAASHNVILKTEVPAGPCRATCDADRMQQVFSNLLSNALRHTPKGGTITIGAAKRGGEIVFSVIDTGTGIAPAYLARIFDPYWQGATASGGLGLGLAVCRAIVEAHHGRIRAESEVGKGTAIVITLPSAG